MKLRLMTMIDDREGVHEDNSKIVPTSRINLRKKEIIHMVTVIGG